ncbi:TPA: prepilin peptidase [Clostridioides difficile]|nr:prepilin peptidase [Clostridioides difficile]
MYSSFDYLKEVEDVFLNPIVVITLTLFLLFASYSDFKYLKIYHKFNFIFFLLRIVFVFLPISSLPLTLSNINGAIFGFCLMYIPAMFCGVSKGGDIRFISILGLYLGFPLLLNMLLITYCSIIIYLIVRKFIFKKNVTNLGIPLAPFVLIGYIINCVIFYI